MTLGSATQADATTGPGAQKNIMAHMYSLLLPNQFLQKIGHPNLSKSATINNNTIPLVVEGTGLEWPSQGSNATYPKIFTPIGQAFTNEMVSTQGAKGARRMIFSPGSAQNGYTVGEFYKHVITAASVDEEVGLIEFRNLNDELGANLVDILDMKHENIKVNKVPGTSYSDMSKGEQEVRKKID